MSTIICNTPMPEYLTPRDNEWLPAIGEILITVGQKLLKTIPDQDTSDWLTFGEVAGLCRRYHYALPFQNYRAKDLQPQILDLFAGRDSIQRQGVKIRHESKEIQAHNARFPKSVHHLKFYRVPTL